MRSVRSIDQRLAPVPRLPFLRRGLDLGNVLLVQAHRVVEAMQPDRNEAVLSDPRHFAGQGNAVAFRNLPNHQQYLGREGARAR